jgi:hypothetical protein
MKSSSFEAIVRAMQDENIRYLVVGGLAVAAHGYLRYTNDVDLVVQLQSQNILKAMRALAKLGYSPRVPVRPEQFADKEVRESWIRDKNMVVMNFYSELHAETPVDVFVSEPFDFDREYDSALVQNLDPDLPVRFVSRETLIHLKRQVGRPQDLADVDQLTLGAELQ